MGLPFPSFLPLAPILTSGPLHLLFPLPGCPYVAPYKAGFRSHTLRDFLDPQI